MSKTFAVLVLSVTCFAAFAQYTDLRLVQAQLCFDYYIPVLRSIALDFSSSYQECAVASGRHFDGFQQRNNTQDLKILITAFASSDFEIERCQNLSRRTFVENTARGYYNLRICLKQIDRLDTTATPTTVETTTVPSSEEDDSSSTQETTGVVNTTGTTTPPSNSVTDGVVNTTGSTTPPSNSVPDGSDSVSKIQISGLLLLLNIWIVYFQSRNS